MLEKYKTYFIIGGLTLLLILGAFLFWVYWNNSDKEKKLIGNIAEQNGANVIVGNLVANQEKVVNEAANNTNRLERDLDNSIKRDTNTFTANSTDTDDNFCRHFPDDSSCANWRLRHPR